ncbi:MULTISPECIES: hypothetical protein [Streptomyces]|uniref:Uncharacterized protein n=1 Tax=Streptomyces koelreuteriae TaxID=2838015 RepID=A0ABX8FU58_9ACTN|nr:MULTISPECIES: hypothetical protein [Streptomyces]QWB24603.1 hypothetical protein KJK29_19530 [Streptomyces koelreuteriae]UUA07612.1 hypothetical protein NNW98_19635 [Streptomyces koelreuteriae]UUA15240.1 hypothetical protein NNW99_19630 [Streptomyces sp. CRCS-T-1]
MTVPCGTRRNSWPRVLVLLLALLLPGAHAEACTGPAVAVSGEGTVVECDVLDTVLRPSARGARRAAVPPRPAPRPAPGPVYTAPRPVPVPPSPTHGSRHLRSEVLRC